MKFNRMSAVACIGLPLLMIAANALAQEAENSMGNEKFATTPVEKIGEERYRIGDIVIDRGTSSFSVSGKILHLGDTLEYLAVSTAGMKEYESLLELSTLPGDFNLACILIGLDEEKSVKPRYQFDEREAEGQRVSISLSWESDGETITVSGSNAIKVGTNAFEDDSWVYIGSSTGNYGKEFMANAGGTLIGFVHDPYSIIDHKIGAGIGNYGLVTANEDVLPDEGAAITLTVAVVAE